MTAIAMTITATAATTGTTRLTFVRKYMIEDSKELLEPPLPSLPSPGISRAGARVPAKTEPLLLFHQSS
jgi:hypothetical protein